MVSRKASRQAFVPYGERWIEERPLGRDTRGYERVFRLHLEPHLGGIDLVDLTTPVVRTWRAGLLAARVGGPTVAVAYWLLRAVTTTAADEDESVRRDPCRIKGADADDHPERPTATAAERGPDSRAESRAP